MVPPCWPICCDGARQLFAWLQDQQPDAVLLGPGQRGCLRQRPALGAAAPRRRVRGPAPRRQHGPLPGDHLNLDQDVTKWAALNEPHFTWSVPLLVTFLALRTLAMRCVLGPKLQMPDGAYTTGEQVTMMLVCTTCGMPLPVSHQVRRTARIATRDLAGTDMSVAVALLTLTTASCSGDLGCNASHLAFQPGSANTGTGAAGERERSDVVRHPGGDGSAGHLCA